MRITFGSIFNIYHWHADFMLHHHRLRDFFNTVIGIFGVAFVRALLVRVMEAFSGSPPQGVSISFQSGMGPYALYNMESF